MSVALLIQPRGTDPEEARLVPIATQDVFKRHWLPACEALALRWVPMFETGIPLEPLDIPPVLTELRVLKRWAEQEAPEISDAIGERLDGLIAELVTLEEQAADVEVFIG